MIWHKGKNNFNYVARELFGNAFSFLIESKKLRQKVLPNELKNSRHTYIYNYLLKWNNIIFKSGANILNESGVAVLINGPHDESKV